MKTGHVSQGSHSRPDVRGGSGKDFTTVLAGEEGSPDNYRLVVVRQESGVYTPRHRHNFDQLRLCISGKVNYGRDRWIAPGQIAYFPEGAPYGPEESDVPRFGVTLQFGGASGSGYLSERQVKTGTEALKKVGTFEKGVYRRSDAAMGERRNQDGFEAVWEHVSGRKLAYPKPRYEEPVLMQPENFEWQPVAGAPGAAVKHLGCFTERELRVALLKLQPNAETRLAARPGLQLGFVLDGAGRIEGEGLRLHSAFELGRGEAGHLATVSGVELLVVGMPMFAPVSAEHSARVRETAPA